MSYSTEMSQEEESPEDESIYFETCLDDRGNLQVIDLRTGEVVSKDADLEAWALEGFTPTRTLVANTVKYVYTPRMGSVIASLMEQGKTLTEISKLPGMPSMGVISRWRRQHYEFNDAILAAKKGRAEGYRDKVHDIALAPTAHKDDAAGPLRTLHSPF